MKTSNMRASGLEVILWAAVVIALINAVIAALNGRWDTAGQSVTMAALAAGWVITAREAKTWREVAAERERTLRSTR